MRSAIALFIFYFFLPLFLAAHPVYAAPGPLPASCWEALEVLRTVRQTAGATIRVFPFDQTHPIERSFEKEGSHYQEIRRLFLKPQRQEQLRQINIDLARRLNEELYGNEQPILSQWLQDYPGAYASTASLSELVINFNWYNLSIHEQLALLFDMGDLRKTVNNKGWASLFENAILPYRYLRPRKIKGHNVVIENSYKNYEMKLRCEIADRQEYFEVRNELEAKLGKPVGQQHFILKWPRNEGVRKVTAEYYAEFLRSLNWLIFWSVLASGQDATVRHLTNIYMTIAYDNDYTHIAIYYINNNPAPFLGPAYPGKYRPLAQRAFPVRSNDQSGDLFIPSLELRTGNFLPELRQFLEDNIEARLGTADYAGLKSILDYTIIPATGFDIGKESAYRVGAGVLTQADKKALVKFTNNNLDDDLLWKLLTPFFKWEALFKFGSQKREFIELRKKYLIKLIEVAQTFKDLKPLAALTTDEAKQRIWSISQAIAPALCEFANGSGLPQRYENYLTPPAVINHD